MKELIIDIKVENRLPILTTLLQNGNYATLLRESCVILEDILRNTYKTIFSELSFKIQCDLFELVKEIGKENKGVEEFGLGQLVGLYRKSCFLNLLEQYLKMDLSLLKAFDMNHVVTLRNKHVHSTDIEQQVSYHEAKMIYDYVMMWLAYLGYATIETQIDSNINPRKQAETNAGDTVPERKKREASIYSSSYGDEKKRLMIQANNTKEIDKRAIDNIITKINKKSYNVLDIGCASGFVTVSRFDNSVFEKIIGIDFNERKIQEAMINHKVHQKFKFHQANIEDENFLNSLETIMKDNEIEKFDIVFSSLTIHHLKEPIKLLKKLRRFMNEGAYIILRGSDDGSKMSYPDKGIMKRIIDLTLSVEGVSDRLNGRKIYNQLMKSGFKNIESFYDINDTCKMSYNEREELFKESFLYRKDYFTKRKDNNPDNKRYIQEYDEICELLDEFEDIFLSPTFYYSEMNIVMIATL